MCMLSPDFRVLRYGAMLRMLYQFLPFLVINEHKTSHHYHRSHPVYCSCCL